MNRFFNALFALLSATWIGIDDALFGTSERLAAEQLALEEAPAIAAQAEFMINFIEDTCTPEQMKPFQPLWDSFRRDLPKQLAENRSHLRRLEAQQTAR